MTHAKMQARRGGLAAALAAMILTVAGSLSGAAAEKKYAPGITDTEIKIGQTMPYSGPASAYGTYGLADAAYFAMINEHGGINGRKITLISLDDAYSPPKTVEQTRKLVEQEGIAFIFGSLGTAANSAIQKYLNDRKIPQIFIRTVASKFNDPRHFPWTVLAANATYYTEGQVYARYVLAHKPDAKIAVLYQNDDYGKDYLNGLKDGLGDQAGKMVVAEASYEVTDATVDSQIVALQASGADTFYNVATPKFAAQAIRKVYDIGWRPLHLLNAQGASLGLVLQPAGLEKSVGLISATTAKDVTDPRWWGDPGYKEWLAWMRKYYPSGSIVDSTNVNAYNSAQVVVHVLEQCGDDLSRENILRQATSLHELALPMLLPGITINNSPTDYEAIKRMYVRRFNGEAWELLEAVVAEK
jgi:branched-chain amino acid transport system substrate-binding protein